MLLCSSRRPVGNMWNWRKQASTKFRCQGPGEVQYFHQWHKRNIFHRGRSHFSSFFFFYFFYFFIFLRCETCFFLVKIVHFGRPQNKLVSKSDKQKKKKKKKKRRKKVLCSFFSYFSPLHFQFSTSSLSNLPSFPIHFPFLNYPSFPRWTAKIPWWRLCPLLPVTPLIWYPYDEPYSFNEPQSNQPEYGRLLPIWEITILSSKIILKSHQNF